MLILFGMMGRYDRIIEGMVRVHIQASSEKQDSQDEEF